MLNLFIPALTYWTKYLVVDGQKDVLWKPTEVFFRQDKYCFPFGNGSSEIRESSGIS